MKLFYSPGSCSLSPHIAMIEAGLKFEIEKLDFATKKTTHGDYNKINPKGQVPALLLDNGEVLTEGAVIIQYIADQKPESKLIAKPGTMERYRTQEWLNFIATEIHKSFSPLFSKNTPEATKELAFKKLTKSFDFVSEHLKKNLYLMGTNYTVADAYLFNMTLWCVGVNFDLTKWPAILGFAERVRNRPSTQTAMKAQGFIN